MTKFIQAHKPASGEMFGAMVAQHKLIRATLEAREDIHWHFWVGNVGPSISTSVDHGSFLSDLVCWLDLYGSRLSVQEFLSLREITEGQEYIFVTGMPLLTSVNEIRHQLACPRLPICGLLHSAFFHGMTPFYLWLAASLGESDTLVATSRAGRKTLAALLEAAQEWIPSQAGVTTQLPRAHLAEIPLGVDVPPIETLDQVNSRALLQVPQDSFVILYLGRISEAFKADLDPLLHAVARLSAKHPSIRLILAGQQIEESDSIHLKSRLSALELRRNSLIIDNFPDYLKSPILSACDVFVSPVDSIQETFGLSIIEAMAHAKPVIASSWSGYRDLVIHGKTGFLLKTRWSSEGADIAAAMTYWSDPYLVAHYLAQRTVIDSAELEHRLAQLMENREARQEMGANGRARVIECFSWPRVSALFLALWTEQIEQAKHIHPIRKRFLDYNRFFSHYADDLLAMEDSLFKIDAQGVTNEELESQWSFSDGSQFEQVTRILALCGNGPIRIGELRRRGFSLDCILWLVKKGLCGILPQNPT